MCPADWGTKEPLTVLNTRICYGGMLDKPFLSHLCLFKGKQKSQQGQTWQTTVSENIHVVDIWGGKTRVTHIHMCFIM